MEYLIKEIIKKLEDINSKVIENSRQSVSLDPDKHSKDAEGKRKERGECC